MAFDLDAAVAEEEEATPFEFTFGDHSYTLPGEPDVRVQVLFDGEHLAEAFELLFGDEQWRWLKDDPKPFTTKHMSALFEEYGKHAGFDPGK